jgi:uncharacterized protein (TIGR02145 family)
MKTSVSFLRKAMNACLQIWIVLITGILFLMSPSCQKYDGELPDQESLEAQSSLDSTVFLKNCPIGGKSDIYYGPKFFKRFFRAPSIETRKIENPNFNCYDGNFVLKIQNGIDKRTRVSSAEIRIDGVLIAGPSDFSKNISFIKKPLPGLTPESVLEVKISSSPGSFMVLWIEGKLISITPAFTQIGPVPQYSSAQELPATSNNGITGTWNPSIISTATAGTTEYTFTPDEGQCAIKVKMNIEVVTNPDVISDVEGNMYKTVKIGDQWWMAENLKVTKYRNGDLIGTTTPVTLDISAESIPKYQWAYNGNESMVDTYGRYYTWYAVTDSRGVCPIGWHVPTDAEWTTLTSYLTNNGFGYEGSGSDIGKALAATSGWSIDAIAGNVGNDQQSNNSSGFTAVPSGVRNSNGTFHNIGFYDSWWSSSEINDTEVWYRRLYSYYNYLGRSNSSKKHGATTRCLKD